MNRNIGKIIAIAILVLGFGGLIIWKLSSRIDYSKYDLSTIIAPTDDNGNLEEHIKGDKNAPVKIVEYADYQCDYCAMYNPRVNKIVEEYDGKVAIIYRNFLLDYHQNGTAAASAAEAAAIQGYWKEYADLLFSNQSTWAYSTATDRLNVFVDYFKQVSDGKGDIDKFKSDMRSDNVSKKISFDMGAGKYQNVDGTPAFYLNGEHIKLVGTSDEDAFLKLFREKIDAALKELEKSTNSEDSAKNSENSAGESDN